MQNDSTFEFEIQPSVDQEKTSNTRDPRQDIAALQAWLDENLEYIQLNKEKPELNLPWYYYSPFLLAVTEDKEYVTSNLSKLCANADISLIVLDDDIPSAMETLSNLYEQVDGLYMLLLPDADILNEEANTEIKQAIHTLIQLFRKKQQVLIVCPCTNKQLNHMDPSFKTAGTFDKRIYIQKRMPAEYAEQFLNIVPKTLFHPSLRTHAEKLGKLIECKLGEDRLINLFVVNLVRMRNQTNQPIHFNDVVRQVINGNTACYFKPANHEMLREIALHEAGHAALAMLTTQGENIPQMVSIIESINHCAMVFDDIDYNYRVDKKPNFYDFINIIRVAMAGRAATELYYDNMASYYSGDYSDIRKANDIARDLIVEYGLTPCKEANKASYTFTMLRSKVTPENAARVEQQVEQLLNNEYAITKAMLQQNKSMLEQIHTLLLEKKELFQEDLLPIWQAHKSQQELLPQIHPAQAQIAE